jgi:3-dehydroquinate dehydratase
VTYRIFLSAPVRRHEYSHRAAVVACSEVVIIGLGISFFAGELVWIVRTASIEQLAKQCVVLNIVRRIW